MENDYSYFTEKIHHLENRVDNPKKAYLDAMKSKRVLVPMNTGTRVTNSKKDYNRQRYKRGN